MLTLPSHPRPPPVGGESELDAGGVGAGAAAVLLRPPAASPQQRESKQRKQRSAKRREAGAMYLRAAVKQTAGARRRNAERRLAQPGGHVCLTSTPTRKESLGTRLVGLLIYSYLENGLRLESSF